LGTPTLIGFDRNHFQVLYFLLALLVLVRLSIIFCILLILDAFDEFGEVFSDISGDGLI